ncbi:hypothetical protein [Flavonifractor sp. AGMB03687]|uniref:hypothetical protein n=1 Tax=Flavonifractor sp. AGMB03687 TaxID=2785133 RepID=UPI001AE0D02C|nr:hypothetical protein [Flavonifractor sp. AGMB03687]
MNLDLLKRLRRLEAEAAQRQAGKTVFLLEGGARFLTEDDPITYLLQHGPQSPRGRIVGYEHTEGREVDPISCSVDECINELLLKGGDDVCV